MDVPLLGHRNYVADFDPITGSVMLRANTPGPAGSLLMELEGMTVAVDAANPGQLSFIDIADARSAVGRTATTNHTTTNNTTSAMSLLTRLVGAEVVERAAMLMATGRQKPQRIDDSGRGRDEQILEAVPDGDRNHRS